MPINVFVSGIINKQWFVVMFNYKVVSFGCVHLSMLPLYNKQLAALLSYTNDALIFIFMAIFPGCMISRYHPNHSVISDLSTYKFFKVWLHWDISIT